MTFELQATDRNSWARAGEINTDHGKIQTPIFMPVGTVGSVKCLHFRELKEDVKAQIILGNTYHLYLRPGLDVLQEAGGLHKFNSWDRPILTDSGGFQVYSLAENRKITEEGVMFRSHIDGSKHLFTPERVMDIERTIGADIMMAFDECPPGQSDFKYAEKSLGLTERWLDRCYKRYKETEDELGNGPYGYHQALFPIVQGCTYPELRRRAAEKIAAMDVEGNAIGGLAVGEPVEKMYEMIEVVNEILPQNRPRSQRTQWYALHQPWHHQHQECQVGTRLLPFAGRWSVVRRSGVFEGLRPSSLPRRRVPRPSNCIHSQPRILSLARRRSPQAHPRRRLQALEGRDAACRDYKIIITLCTFELFLQQAPSSLAL